MTSRAISVRYKYLLAHVGRHESPALRIGRSPRSDPECPHGRQSLDWVRGSNPWRRTKPQVKARAVTTRLSRSSNDRLLAAFACRHRTVVCVQPVAGRSRVVQPPVDPARIGVHCRAGKPTLNGPTTSTPLTTTLVAGTLPAAPAATPQRIRIEYIGAASASPSRVISTSAWRWARAACSRVVSNSLNIFREPGAQLRCQPRAPAAGWPGWPRRTGLPRPRRRRLRPALLPRGAGPALLGWLWPSQRRPARPLLVVTASICASAAPGSDLVRNSSTRVYNCSPSSSTMPAT